MKTPAAVQGLQEPFRNQPPKESPILFILAFWGASLQSNFERVLKMDNETSTTNGFLCPNVLKLARHIGTFPHKDEITDILIELLKEGEKLGIKKLYKTKTKIKAPIEKRNIYKKLKALIYSEGIVQADIAKKLKRSTTYVNERFTGKKSFDLEEVYTLCDWLHIDYNQISSYFPPRGKYDAKNTLQNE